MVTIVCMKWGSEFTARHVNSLYAGVLRNMEEPFQFVCLTSDGRNLAPGIVVRSIPDLGLPERAWRRGCWPKLGVFAPYLFPDEDVVLFLDLDVMVQSSLAPFIEVVRTRRHLVIQREWNPDLWSLLPHKLRPDRGAQSSVLGFCPPAVERIYKNFMTDPAALSATFGNDQTYLTETVKDRSYWPIGFCVSFKRSCTKYVPFNIFLPTIRQPKNAKIIVFHGKPRPWETLVKGGQRWGSKWRFGIGPVPWIVRYFDQADAMIESMTTNQARTHVFGGAASPQLVLSNDSPRQVALLASPSSAARLIVVSANETLD